GVEAVDVHQLIAGGEHRDAWTTVDGHVSASDRGQDAKLARAKHRTAPDGEFAGPKILAARPHVAAGVPCVVDRHAFGTPIRILDANDRVCVRRQWRAGHDAARRADLDRARGAPSRTNGFE